MQNEIDTPLKSRARKFVSKDHEILRRALLPPHHILTEASHPHCGAGIPRQDLRAMFFCDVHILRQSNDSPAR